MGNDYHIFFSSNTNEWATPQKLFDDLNEEFHFTLDPASTHENAKCEKHFTMEEDGLQQSWGGNQFSVILHMVKALTSGSGNPGKNPVNLIPLWSC